MGPWRHDASSRGSSSNRTPRPAFGRWSRPFSSRTTSTVRTSRSVAANVIPTNRERPTKNRRSASSSGTRRSSRCDRTFRVKHRCPVDYAVAAVGTSLSVQRRMPDAGRSGTRKFLPDACPATTSSASVAFDARTNSAADFFVCSQPMEERNSRAVQAVLDRSWPIRSMSTRTCDNHVFPASSQFVLPEWQTTKENLRRFAS